MGTEEPASRAASQAAARDARDELVDQLRADLAFLQQLTEHQAGIIMQLSQRVAELPSGTTVAPDPPPDTAPAPPARRS